MTEKEFETVWQQYFSAVYRYALSLCGSESVAEEVTAQCFFQALAAIDRFAGKSSLYSWLCAIAKNCWLTMLRRQKREVPLSDEQEAGVATDAASDAERRAYAAHVMQLVQQLPQPYHEVFLLRVFAEQGFREIGRKFGKSENWACVTYHRAQKKLREQLEDEDEI